jgi:protein-tyrosine-phosphatase
MNKADTKIALPAGFEYLAQPANIFIQKFPHIDRNVFVMMPFTANSTDAIYDAVRLSIERHGLVSLRADQTQCSEFVWWNILTYMIGSSYGIVIYEPKDKIPFNPNVSIEAGFMLALDRPVLLLANKRVATLPVDFSGRVFKTFRTEDISSSVDQAVSDWIERDISYFRYGDKKLVVFVSLGGTCRCVMAKGIFLDRLQKAKISTIAVEAAAVAEPPHSKISVSAVRALDEINCSRWLDGHRPRKLSQYLQDRADLVILLTDRHIRKGRRSKKIKTDVKLFGYPVMNPAPDYEDDASLIKYREARTNIEKAIDDNFMRILDLAKARPSL